MKRVEKNLVVCISNKGYPASLRKMYESISDHKAANLHQIRVIDESGEDYLHPEEYFVPIQLPPLRKGAVLRAR